MVAVVDRSTCPRFSAPKSEDYEKFMNSHCIWHDRGKHTNRECNNMTWFALEILKGANKVAPAKKQEKDGEEKDSFQEADKELTHHEVFLVDSPSP